MGQLGVSIVSSCEKNDHIIKRGLTVYLYVAACSGEDLQVAGLLVAFRLGHKSLGV